MRLYILPFFGKKRISRLSTEDIRRYQRQLLSHQVSGGRTMALSTAREATSRFHDMIKHALDGTDAREAWGISFDPWPLRRLKWPDEREKPAPCTYVPYTVEEARTYLAATPEHLVPHVLSIILLMLRDGEFRAMKWRNLEWEDRLYYVHETHSRDHGFTTAKTAASEAPVPVPNILLDALTTHKKRQSEWRLMKGERWEDHDLIFPSRKGLPLTYNVMSQFWHPQIVEKAGLRYVSLHTLRKTGSTLLEGIPGVSRQETMAALRHKRATVTDRYVTINMEQRRRHIEEVAALLTDDLPSFALNLPSKSGNSG